MDEGMLDRDTVVRTAQIIADSLAPSMLVAEARAAEAELEVRREWWDGYAHGLRDAMQAIQTTGAVIRANGPVQS